ncbi:MAG: DUF2059 domain-containing protein [Rhodobacterales bacterium]|nr:DUF2059 domain-containing protein [Rhodobacterales bacterium]
MGVISLSLAFAVPAQAAAQERLETFLEVTGFDVALNSIALSAGDAPRMLGMGDQNFGSDWTRLAAEVFDPVKMRASALDILGATLEEDLLDHVVAFYASDLGQRLVIAENASHMDEDKDARRLKGQALIADLQAEGSARIEYFNRMGKAIDGAGTSVRAAQEVQIRFLMAAAAAGVIQLKMEESDMRAAMARQADEMRSTMAATALASSAFVYREFSDADLETYTLALEDTRMRTVYELMTAVQYEIMANRFEVLAARMADMHPGQDI